MSYSEIKGLKIYYTDLPFTESQHLDKKAIELYEHIENKS